MKLKTVRVRRSHPSALSVAMALMLTMLFVYLISLSAAPKQEGDAVAAQATGSAEVRMEGLEVAFDCASSHENLLEARVAAANCAQSGGAGLILAEGGRYAVVREALPAESAAKGAPVRSAGGLTMQLSGPAGETGAVADSVAFLRGQASETGSLAAALEGGGTDAPSIAALLRVYRTQGGRALEDLEALRAQNAIAARLGSSVQAALDRLDAAIDAPDAGKLRLIHAAACAEWIALLNEFAEAA